MEYTWSLLRFLKLTLIVTSIYWCVLLSVLIFLLLGQCSSDADSTSAAQADLLTIVFVIILSVCGGALVILLVAFHLVSQHYFKDSGKMISHH